jgi:hypothetical protein
VGALEVAAVTVLLWLHQARMQHNNNNNNNSKKTKTKTKTKENRT